MTQLRRKLPAMLGHAGYEQIALRIDPSQLMPTLDEVEAQACEMAIRKRRTVRHNRGTDVIEAGNIRFGLEMRVAGQGDGGMAIHVLGDIAGQEVELLAFEVQERADLSGQNAGAGSLQVGGRSVQDREASGHADA